jgi:hypothetical protein
VRKAKISSRGGVGEVYFKGKCSVVGSVTDESSHHPDEAAEDVARTEDDESLVLSFLGCWLRRRVWVCGGRLSSGGV